MMSDRRVQVLCLPGIFALIFGLTACAGGQQSTTPNPEMPAGTVDITFPTDGSIIYAETLTIQGTATELPENNFRLQVITAMDETLADIIVQPENTDWQIELVHQYEGDPTEISIIALPAENASNADYDFVSTVLSPLTMRPNGMYGTILSPGPESQIGGDILTVTGTVSGVPTNTIQLALEIDGNIAQTENVEITNPAIIDEVIWSTQISIQGYNGQAALILYAADGNTEISLDQVDFTLIASAG